MAQFRVKVLVQCAQPDVTPDVENELVPMPRRVLFTPPPFLAEMLTRASNAVEVTSDALDEPQLALEAAKKVVPSGFKLDVVRKPFAHREVDGTYLATGAGEYVFILGRESTTEVRPYTLRQRHQLRAAGSTEEPRDVQVEFRCHLVVSAL